MFKEIKDATKEVMAEMNQSPVSVGQLTQGSQLCADYIKAIQALGISPGRLLVYTVAHIVDSSNLPLEKVPALVDAALVLCNRAQPGASS